VSSDLALALPFARREQAASHYRSLGVPGRRIEEWKYSDLRAALGEAGLDQGTASWKLGALPDGVEAFDLADVHAPDWVKTHFGSLKENALSAASLAYAQGGVALRVSKQAQAPLSVEFSGAGNLRVLIVLDAHAELTLQENLAGTQQRNVGVEIVLGATAQLNHVRLAPAAAGAVQIEEVSMTLARDARYHGHYASFGAKLSRLELDIALEGEGAEAHLSGVTVLGAGHADVTSRIHHAVGATQSTQLFKHVAGGKSRAVYQGKVAVAAGADGSDSRQTAKALLLGHQAEADMKPELEIFADDVKCAHGAAVGDLDADSLFYLRARGLPENEARTLLIHAFLEEAVDAIAHDDLRQQVRDAVNDALESLA
jgi:Fe-S cluster assembly protein SufD